MASPSKSGSSDTEPESCTILASSTSEMDAAQRLKQIAERLTRLYDLHIMAGFATSEAILSPPHNDIMLNTTACNSNGIGVNAIEFLKTIPWYTGPQAFPLLNGLHSFPVGDGRTGTSYAVNYCNRIDIEKSRRPGDARYTGYVGPYDDPNETLPPNAVAIAMPTVQGTGASKDAYGVYVVDVDTGMLRASSLWFKFVLADKHVGFLHYYESDCDYFCSENAIHDPNEFFNGKLDELVDVHSLPALP